MTALHITHSITGDALDGRPWPPTDDVTALWMIVRRSNGLTMWRSLRLLPSDPPPADVHLNFGGTQPKGACNGD
jgi:hypothetical protein